MQVITDEKTITSEKVITNEQVMEKLAAIEKLIMEQHAKEQDTSKDLGLFELTLLNKDNKMKPVLDACCGSRMFHFDKNNPYVLFADNRTFESTLCDGRKLKIDPDVIHDFTDMPYPDKSFKCVIFDPPHLMKGGDKSWLIQKYGRLDKDWQEQLKKGFDECMRVLDDFGTLIFKWNETQISVNEILKTLDVQPIIGHKSGKANNTHWMLFLKI